MGVVPLLADRDLFSRLIDIFPLARIIKNDECTLEIPPRALDGLPSQVAATLVVDMYFYAGYMSDSFTVTADFRMLPHCLVEYNVDIQDCDMEDWDISVWDNLDVLGDGTKLPSNPDSDSEQEALSSTIAEVLCRPIRSLKVTDPSPTSHLADLSDHLDRRAKTLFRPVADLRLTAYHAEDVPVFLRCHPEIARYEWRSGGAGTCVGFVDALMLDWDGRSEGPTLALRHLVIDADLKWNNQCFRNPVTTEGDIRGVVQRRMACPSFADLDTLTFKLDGPRELTHVGNVFKSFPQLSTIAKALVQIGGTRFELIIEAYNHDNHPQWHTRLLQSSLTLEVLARQAKERKKPKYIRSISGDGA